MSEEGRTVISTGERKAKGGVIFQGTNLRTKPGLDFLRGVLHPLPPPPAQTRPRCPEGREWGPSYSVFAAKVVQGTCFYF